MQRISSYRIFLCVGLALSLLNACNKSAAPKSTQKSAENTAQTDNQEAILIGEVDSMTGNEATYGIDTNRGLELALSQANESGGVNGRKIRLITSDVQGKPDEGARAISRLISQSKVAAIVTGTTSPIALAMAPLAQHHQIPLVATAATNPKLTELGNFIFRVCFIDPFQGRIMAKFALDTLKAKKVAILRDMRSDYSIGLADVFTEVLKGAGGEIIIDQSYSGGDIDFRSQLTAIRGKNPEAIFVPGYYTDVSLIARQVRELGIVVPLLGADGWDSPKLKEIGGTALKGSYFSNFYSADIPSPFLKDFLENFKKLYGVVPNGSAAMGYEAGLFLVNALRTAKSLDPKDIREAMAATQNFETLNGKMTIDRNRNAIKSVVVLKIDNDGSPRFWSTVNP